MFWNWLSKLIARWLVCWNFLIHQCLYPNECSIIHQSNHAEIKIHVHRLCTALAGRGCVVVIYPCYVYEYNPGSLRRELLIQPSVIRCSTFYVFTYFKTFRLDWVWILNWVLDRKILPMSTYCSSAICYILWKWCVTTCHQTATGSQRECTIYLCFFALQPSCYITSMPPLTPVSSCWEHGLFF